MKKLIGVALAAAFVLPASAMAAPPSNATLAKQNKALAKQVSALSKQVRALSGKVATANSNASAAAEDAAAANAQNTKEDQAITLSVDLTVCYDAITWDAFSIFSQAVFGSPLPRIDDKGACAAVGITRSG